MELPRFYDIIFFVKIHYERHHSGKDFFKVVTKQVYFMHPIKIVCAKTP